MTMVELAIEAVGWAAALLILAAYALLSAGKLTAHDRSYQWMNVLGGSVSSSIRGGMGDPLGCLKVVWEG